MALTLEEVRAQIRQIQRDYAGEDPDIIADAIATYAAENDVDQDIFSAAMDTVRQQTFRSDANAALAGEGGGDGTGVVNLTPIRSGEGVTYSLPPAYTLADVQVAGRPLMDEAQLQQFLPYDPYDIEQRRAYEVAGPREVTFYDQILNRPVPVIGADGSVSMGNARLPSSGVMDITPGAAAEVITETPTETVTEEEEMVMSPGMRQQLQQIYLSSPNVEIAGQRIADYARSVGGLSSQQIANVINQVIPQGGEGLLETGSRLTAPVVEEAARAGNLDITGTSVLSDDPMERLRQLYTPGGATGTGAYTNLEAAYRVLDEGARSGLSLDQVGSAFNLTPERTRQVLTDVGIDPSTYSTVPVAQSFEAQEVPQGTALSQLTGIQSLSTPMGSQLIQPAVSGVQERLSGMYDPSQRGTEAELQTAQNILQQGLASGLNLNQIGASFNLTPEQTRQELLRAGVDTSTIPGFQKGGAVVDTGDQGGNQSSGFFSSVGRGIAGLAGYAKDKMFGDVPEYMDSVEDVRFSGRPQSQYREEYYGEGPTFEERLVMEYGYPESPERPGSADFTRTSRPTDRPDLPATSEILDARAHALGSALYGKEYGEEASSAMGSLGEIYDQTFDSASREDIEMDTRNNAVGRKILRNAGIMATTRDLTKMVDQQILDQLDRIMDRPAEKRRAQSPEGGPDLYFSRLDPRTLKTTTDPGGIINVGTSSRHPGGI